MLFNFPVRKSGLISRPLFYATVFFTCASLFTAKAASHDTLLHDQQLAALCKAWGLMKYYHPAVAKKQIDWDGLFLKHYPHFQQAATHAGFNDALKKLLLEAGLRPRTFSPHDSAQWRALLAGDLFNVGSFRPIADTGRYKMNMDFKWISDPLYNPEVQQLLAQVLIDFRPVKNKYLRGKIVLTHRENPFSELDSLTEAHQVLGLFRYWNLVTYFFPYKYLMDKDWNAVLADHIPLFRQTLSKYAYLSRLGMLSTYLNDSHATGTRFGQGSGLIKNISRPAVVPVYRVPPFKFQLAGNQLVIDEVLDTVLLSEGKILPGDVLLKVNGKTPAVLLDGLKQRVPFSTPQAFRHTVRYTLIYFMLDTASFKIDIQRGQDTLRLENIVGVNSNAWLKYPVRVADQSFADGRVGYIHLSEVSVRKFKKAFRKYSKNDAIILDMRGYPMSLAPLFLPARYSRRPKPVAHYFYPSKEFAGVFIKDRQPENYYTENIAAFFLKELLDIRRKILPVFTRPYEGLTLMLISEDAVSYSETTCMIMQAYAKNVVFIGTPTQGANGDIITVHLPGGVITHFSSLDWHYPDGGQLQRIGVKPDIEVAPTIESIRRGKDEVLDRAVELAIKHINR